MATAVVEVLVEVRGERYRVAAVAGADRVWRPDVRELGPDGAAVRTLVDAARTDEEHEGARACLLGALARVL